jgi:hypothetical protein
VDFSGPEYVIIDPEIIAEEGSVVFDVSEEAADESGEMDDMGRLVGIEDAERLVQFAEVTVHVSGEEDPLLLHAPPPESGSHWLRLDDVLQR